VIDIDFLPQTYHQERARRAQIYKQWVMILLTAVTLAGWGISRQQQSAELASRTNSLETLANDTRQKQSEMDKLRKDHKSLAYQLKIQRQLDQPVATTQVVSVLGQLLPGSSGLTQIEIKTQRPPPIPLSDPNKKKKKPKRNASPQPPPKDFLEIDVYGIAPDDVEVAQMMNSMSDHPLFEKVIMHYSRTEERGEIISRRFHIGAKVPLNKRYLPLSKTAEASYED
jgi:Tfp pilus assembly protein PilN